MILDQVPIAIVQGVEGNAVQQAMRHDHQSMRRAQRLRQRCHEDLVEVPQLAPRVRDERGVRLLPAVRQRAFDLKTSELDVLLEIVAAGEVSYAPDLVGTQHERHDLVPCNEVLDHCRVAVNQRTGPRRVDGSCEQPGQPLRCSEPVLQCLQCPLARVDILPPPPDGVGPSVVFRQPAIQGVELSTNTQHLLQQRSGGTVGRHGARRRGRLDCSSHEVQHRAAPGLLDDPERLAEPIGGRMDQQTGDKVLVDRAAILDIGRPETVCLERPAYAFDLRDCRTQVRQRLFGPPLPAAQSRPQVQHVRQQRGQVVVPGGLKSTGDPPFGPIEVVGRQRGEREVPMSDGALGGPILEQGERRLEQRLRLRAVTARERELALEQRNAAGARRVTQRREAVPGPGEHCRGLLEPPQCRERPAEPGPSSCSFQHQPVPVECRQGRGVCLGGLRQQPGTGQRIGLLRLDSRQVTGGPVRLEVAPRLLEVVQRCLQSALPAQDVGEIALHDRRGTHHAAFFEGVPGRGEGGLGVSELIEFQQCVGATAVHMRQGDGIVGEGQAGAVEMLQRPGGVVTHPERDAQVHFGLGRPLVEPVPVESFPSGLSGCDRVVVPAQPRQCVDHRQAGTGGSRLVGSFVSTLDSLLQRGQRLVEAVGVRQRLGTRPVRPGAGARPGHGVGDVHERGGGLHRVLEVLHDKLLRFAGKRGHDLVGITVRFQQPRAILRYAAGQVFQKSCEVTGW